MAVQDCEITLRWVEFEGDQISQRWGTVPSPESFFGAIWEDNAVFGIWYGDGEYPNIDPGSGVSEAALEIPLVVFQRAQRSMAEPDWTTSEMRGYGSFRKEGDNRVRYATECGQEYEFDLDDIIELFGP